MKKYMLPIMAMGAASALSAQTAIPGLIQTDTTLTADQDWLIDGIVYVDGATLTIEPGTTVYAAEGNGADASALIVASTGQLVAEGTASKPIVFTSIKAMSEELDHNHIGLWAGIIMLGDAVINAGSADQASGEGVVLTNLIEGISAIGRHGLTADAEQALLTYGGSDDFDSSGIVKYVSIRHTGVSLTGEPGDEIQGLTLGAIGSETILENIEIFGSADDGIEIFGGTANLRNIVLAYAEDDSLDLDHGYRGTAQNVVIMQVDFTDSFGVSRDGDHGGEWDGADSPETNNPSMEFVLSNATFIQTGVNGGTNDDIIRIRNAGGAQVWNSVFVTNDDQWIRLDNNDSGAGNTIVEDKFNAGTTAFVGNIFHNGVATSLEAGLFDINDFTQDSALVVASITDVANKNMVADPMIGVSVTEGGMIMVDYPVVGSGSPLYDSSNVVALPTGGFLNEVSYVGAFDSNENWAHWTFAAKKGYLTMPGYIFSAQLGWVYSFTGSISDNSWLWQLSSGSFIYVATDDAAGTWIYIAK